MATKTLIGTSLSTWAAGNFVGGTAPVANDAVALPATALVSLAGSSLDLSAGDSSDAGVDTLGLDFTTLDIARGCQISIGSAAAPLKCLFKTSVSHLGSGALFYHAANSSAFGPYTTALVKIDSPNSIDAFNLLGVRTIDEAQVISGGCTHDGPTVTLLILAPKGVTGTSWTTASGTQCPTTVFMSGGELSVYAGSSATVYMRGGVFTVNYIAGSRGPTVFMSGGLLRCNSAENGASFGENITATGGIVDFTKLSPNTLAGPFVGFFKHTRNLTIIGDYTISSGGAETIIGE